MSLIRLGDFTLSSGKKSGWKLEAGRFIEENLDGLVALVRGLVGPFSSVGGVPSGGDLLADALRPFQTSTGRGPHLLVDDVLTTGQSLNRARVDWASNNPGHPISPVGAVVFARGQCPLWVKAVFQLPECFWLAPRTRR